MEEEALAERREVASHLPVELQKLLAGRQTVRAGAGLRGHHRHVAPRRLADHRPHGAQLPDEVLRVRRISDIRVYREDVHVLS